MVFVDEFSLLRVSFTISVYHLKKDKYCGFNYLNSTLYENKAESFYGDCTAKRNYFCKNKTGNFFVLLYDITLYANEYDSCKCEI
jgi:hypothetical protein